MEKRFAVPVALFLFFTISYGGFAFAAGSVLVWSTGNSGYDTPGVAADLMVNGGFTTVDALDQVATVPLATLTLYDAVVYFSNSSAGQDPVAIGNVLADYADAGGGLVIASFAWADQGGNTLAGRIIDQGLSPFVAIGAPPYTEASMDWNDGSALFDGVSSLTTQYQNTVSLTSGAVLCATLSDGLPLVATRRNVAGVNFFPDASAGSQTGDFDVLLANVVWESMGVVYDNGFTDPATGNGNEMSGWVQADDFELASPALLTGIFVEWFELTQGTWHGQVQWFLFEDDAGSPGALLHQGSGYNRSTVLFATDQGWYWKRTAVDFDRGVGLSAGTRYWIGLHWGPPGDFVADGVFWANTEIGGFGTSGHESSGGTFDNWNDNGYHRAFKILSGDEPCGLFCDGFESGDINPWTGATG